MALLRRAYKLAQRAGRLLHAPHVPMLRESNPRSGFFEREQIDAVIGHLPAHLKPVVRFGYLTGWRTSYRPVTSSRPRKLDPATDAK